MPSVKTAAVRLRYWLPAALALGLFMAVLFVIHRELAGLHLRDVLRYLRTISPGAVQAATGLCLLSYALLGSFDMLGLRYVGRRLPYARVATVSFVTYALSHNLGAGVFASGALRYRLYTAAGLSGLEIATLQGFCSATSLLGIAIVAGGSLLLAPQDAAVALRLLQPWATAVGLLLLLVVAAYAVWGCLGRSDVEFRGWTPRPPGPAITLLQLATATVELCVAAAVLWWLLPADANAGFVSFLGAYALAVLAGMASHVPAGLGVFESTILIAMPGVPAAPLLGALVAYRAIYYLLPLLIAGLVFAAQELRVQLPHLVRLEARVSALVAPVAPQIIGALVFAAGIILLVSGATPGINSRLAALHRLVPLPVIELSQLAGSVCGLGMLILSRALFRRVREAYRLTGWLLGAGALASILKGLDFEEAVFLALVSGVLWLSRRSFHRRASIIEDRFSPAWIASIIGVLGAVTWIGLFAHRHVEYTHDLWWTFAMAADAPRMLRASLVAVLAAGGFLMLNLLRPARPEPELPSPADLDRAGKVISGSGSTLANVALAGDKRLLFAPQDDAFIMYQVARRSWVALGDPVGERQRGEELTWRLRELADRHGGWVVFYQVSADRLPLYVDLGLSPIKIGEEGRVALGDFGLDGSARAELRQSHRRALRDGATFDVVPAAGVAPILPALQRVSDAWLGDKAAAEKGFSVGAFRADYLSRFPMAVVRCAGEPVAFANVWTTDTLEELSIDLMRFGPEAPRSAMDFLLVELMLWGRAQGYQWFNLGMAPLAGLEQHPLAPSWHRVGNFVFRHGEHFYNFEGLRRYKEKFAPAWEPKYLAAPGGTLVLPRVLLDVAILVAGSVRALLTS